MRHQKLLHQSFAGGEISPDMFSRVEDPRFRNGAALISNMICKPQGSIMRRPGTQFIRKVRDSNAKVRLLPFTFANGDTFAIEIGRATIDSREIGYFRFHTKGGTLLFDKPRDYVAEQAVTTTSGNVRVGPVVITHTVAIPSSGTLASITATNSGAFGSTVVAGDIVVVGSSTGVVASVSSTGSVITLTTAGWSPARPEPVATSATVYNSITGNNLPVIFTTSAPHQLLTGDPVVFTVNDGFIDTSSISGINVCSAGSTLRLASTAIVTTASNVRVPAVGSISINAPTATTITATSGTSNPFNGVNPGDIVVVPNTINGVAGNSTGIVLSATNSVITLTPAGWSPLGVTPNGPSATVYFPMTITAASGTPFATFSSVLPGDIVVVSNSNSSSTGIVASVSSTGSVITFTPASWFSALVGGTSATATIYSPPSNNPILWTSQESSKILHGDQVVIGAETMPTYGDKQLERDRIYYAYNDFGWTGKASANGNIKTITSDNISPAIVNNAAVGRKLIITSGLLNGSETEITSNTTSTITFTAFGSTYSGTYDYPGSNNNSFYQHRTGQIISSNITPPLPSGILNGKGHRIYFPGLGYYAEILSNDNILNGTTAYSRITFVPLWFGTSAANGLIFQIIPVISKSDTFLIGANKNTFGISETKFGTPLNFNSNVVYNLTTTTSSTPSNIFFNVSSEIPHPEVDGLLTDKNYKVLITSGPLFGIERLITSSSFYTVNSSIVVSRIDVYPPFSLTVGGAVTSVGAGITFVIVPPVSVAPVRQPIKVNNTYYVNKQSGNTFAVSTTKDKALVGDTLASNVGAINPAYQLRMHYDYRAGDLAYIITPTIGSFSCMRIPWGSSENNGYCYKDDHLGHPPPANDTYWCRVAGNGTDKRGQQILVTCDQNTDRITCSGHGLDNGEPVIINFTTSPSVGSIAEGAVLYVRNKNTNDFEVSATAFGPKINLTSAGSNVKIFCAPYYDVPHYYSASDIAELTTTQSNNVLSIACRNKPFSELKRINAGRWEHSEVKFISNVLAPTNFGCRLSEFSETLPRGVQGQGNQVSITSVNPAILTTISAHSIGSDEPIYVFGLSTYGIPDGDYVTSSSGTSQTTITLMELLSGKPVVATSLGSLFGYVQPTLAAINISNSYVVTAIDSNGIESNPSAAVVVKNNMFVAGAYNPFAWSEVTGASLYRIYKNVNGLYGVIGEVTGTTFKDDNIAADYAVSPPILDNSLLSKTNVVSWNSATNIVTVDKQSPPEGSPVIFETNKTIPTNIKEGITYYAYNSAGSTFQLVATPGSATPLLLGGSVTGQAICKTGYFPGAVSYFEGRRVFGGSLMLPQDVWMTASGTESDLSYSLPTVDSDRIRFRIALREAAIVLHLMPMSHLLMLTNSGEIRLTPINSDSITPNSVSVRPQSYVGSGISSPVIVNNVVVYAAARGGHVRELGFKQDEDGYQSGNLSLRTSHLFDDYSIVQMAYQKAPLSTVWCVSSSGKLLGITYLPEEQLGAWHQHSTDGTFESIVALPEGKEDSIYLSVKRGNTRYIERMAQQEVTSLADTFFMDCGVAYDGTATTAIIGLEHLNGKAVDYVADGVVGSGLVANGQLTLAKAAAKVRVGLPFTAQVVSIPIVMQTQTDTASASGREKNINKAWVRVYESGQFRMGPVLETPTLTAAAQVNSRTLNSGLLTGLEPITLTGSWSDEGQIMIQSKGANPLTVVGITFEVATGG